MDPRNRPGRDAVLVGALLLVLAVWPAVAAFVVNARQPEPTPFPLWLWALNLLLSAVGCVAIGLRHRWPGTMLVVTTAAVLAGVAADLPALGAGVGLLICAYAVAVVVPWRAAAVALAGCALAHAAGGVLLGDGDQRLLTYWGVPGRAVGDTITATIATFCVPVLIGVYLRGRRARLAALVERADRLEAERQERDRRAAAAERNRIARDLHDIAAHDLSAIVVQAGAADRLVDRDPAAARDALLGIRRQGRTTLTALRQLVGILRAGDDEAGPPPTLAGLDGLVSGFRSAGMTVDMTMSGTPVALPAVIDVTAYRVVQESLTNARRHAPGMPVTLSVVHGRGLTIDVHNGLSAGGGAVDGTAVVDGAATVDGYGLASMRERVTGAGGSMSAGACGAGSGRPCSGPSAGGTEAGWHVHVELPA